MSGRPMDPVAAWAAPALAALAVELRALRGDMAMRDIAGVAGTSVSTVSRVMRGQVVPRWEVLRSIVVACGGDQEGFRDLWAGAEAERKPGMGRPDRIAERLVHLEAVVREQQARIERLEQGTR